MKPTAMTLRDFLSSLFGEGRADVVHICHFGADPGLSQSKWKGRRLGAAETLPDNDNQYFCIAELEPDQPRQIGFVRAHWMLVADDVGTKASVAQVESTLPPPTYKIETSPGNQTWIWALDAPVIPAIDQKGAAVITAIREGMKDLGLGDKGTFDAVRYIRLPYGKNTKEKYASPFDGSFPSVQLVEATGAKYDLEMLAYAVLGEDWENIAADPQFMTSAQLSSAGGLAFSALFDDPIIRMADEIGLQPRQGAGPGRIDAICPNAANHTVRGDTGFAFLGGGTMACHHTACVDLRSPDFTAMICEAWDDMAKQARERVAAAEAIGLPASEADKRFQNQTSEGYLARLEFERIMRNEAPGALSADAGEFDQAFSSGADPVERLQSAAADLAERMGGDLSSRDAQFNALFDRYVYVDQAELFFDVRTGARLTIEQFDKLPDVLRLWPLGGKRKDRGSTQLLNEIGRLRRGVSFAYVPGAGPIVDEESETGIVLPHVNTYMPSPIRPVAQLPRKWLDLLSYVIQDRKARHYMIQCLAWIVQNPGKRLPVMLVLHGASGVGKDMLFGSFMRALGLHNCASVTYAQLQTGFNEWMAAQLVMLPELNLQGNKALIAMFKDLIAGGMPWVWINPKYGKKYRVRAQATMIATTNDLDALSGLDLDDRRVWFHSSEAERLASGAATEKGSPAYYAQRYHELNDPQEIGRVYWMLSRVNLTNFNPFDAAPRNNQHKQLMVVEGLTQAARWVYDLVIEGEFASRDAVTVGEIEQRASSREAPNVVRNTITVKSISQGLRAAGFDVADRIRLSVGGRARVWARHPDTLKGTASDIRQFYEDDLAQYLADKKKAELALINH